MPKCQTWIIVIKMKVAQEIERRGPFRPLGRDGRGSFSPLDIDTSNAIRIDKPVIIIPDGEAEQVEIIPIIGPAVLHGQNIKRRFIK